MALTVYAESMGFFHKGCAGTGIAPLDVCLSPPPGPVPIPYTNVLFAQDLIKGSKTVRIDGEPTFLEDVSMTSKSIGDEGGTLGGSVVSGVILKNGYFTQWSSTVYIEGKAVDRHGDLMGQNSAGGAPPSSLDAGSICKPGTVKAPDPAPVASRRAAEAKVLDATGPGDSKPPEVVPCAWDKVTIECDHSGSGDGKRGFGPFEFTYTGKIEDNLPRPKQGSKRIFSPNIQVIAGEDERRADHLAVEITGGPGYSCSHRHPHLIITDKSTGKPIKQEGATKAKLALECKTIEMPAFAYMSPAAVIGYFFFSPKTTASYRLELASCGVNADKSPGFGRLARDIDVHSSDTYKFSMSIPEVLNRSYENGATRKLEGGAKWEGQDKPGWDGTLKENSEWFGKPASEGAAPPVNIPAKKTGASISFTRNSEDISAATGSLEDIITGILNVQDAAQAVMNFIENWQPQVGWSFTFKMAFFSGDLSFEWGAKEWKDHTVFRWWKFEAALTLAKVELEVDFGVKFKVKGFGVVAVLFGKVEGEVPLKGSAEATPDEPEWSMSIGAEIKGELGVKASLGADWLASGEGKIGLGFPVEASPKIDDEDGLKIDWKFAFSGLEAHVVGRIFGLGKFSRKFEFIKPRTIGQGTFPGGDKKDEGIASPQGAIK